MHWTSFAEHCHTSHQVNDIRPGADPVNERIKSQLVAKHGQDFKSKVFVSILQILFAITLFNGLSDYDCIKSETLVIIEIVVPIKIMAGVHYL